MKSEKNYLLCWHAKNNGLQVLYNCINLLKEKQNINITNVIYLVQDKKIKNSDFTNLSKIKVEQHIISLSSPTVHQEIYDELEKRIDLFQKKNIHINISPGTPAMHAVLANYACSWFISNKFKTLVITTNPR